MKKMLIALNVVFAAVIIFQACRPTVVNRCKDVFNKDYSQRPWRGQVPYDAAKMLSANYAADSGKRYVWNGSTATGLEDARSIWFGIETLKKFLWEIEKNNCENGCTDSLGVRMYFARYPDSLQASRFPELRGLDPRFANRHTLLMVPTYWNAQRRMNIDFDPAEGCRKPLIDKSRVFFIFPGAGFEGGDDFNQNHGGLMPPPAGSGSLPTQ